MIRHLFIPVIYRPQFLTQKGSSLDVSVLRTAHRALLRQQSGITDTFLFVLCGEITPEDATAAIAAYGFPDATVFCVNTKDEDGTDIEDENVREHIGSVISHWIDACHLGAITSLSQGDYDSLDMWWAGIDSTGVEADFAAAYAATLPDTHRGKAGTWLAILAEMLGLKGPFSLSDNRLALYAVTLCEWLHGFEAASGNFYNGFESCEVSEALQLGDYDIQELLTAQGDENECLDEMLCNSEEAKEDEDDIEEVEDIDEIRSDALKQVTSNERSRLRRMLSNYFGSDTTLLWALHTAIWPQFDQPSADLCSVLVSPGEYEVYADVSDAWEFVTTGWTDSADE